MKIEDYTKNIGKYAISQVDNNGFDFKDLVKIQKVFEAGDGEITYMVEKIKILYSKKQRHDVDRYNMPVKSITEFFNREDNPEYFL